MSVPLPKRTSSSANGMSASSEPLSKEAKMALDNFIQSNGIEAVDDIYRYDRDAHNAQVMAEGYKQDVHYFKKARISALALLKMVMHARSGGKLEVMGIMQGKIDGDTMIVMDSFALAVEGTETRVNAGDAEAGYMVTYMEMIQRVGRHENMLGWYHSHPGYGCWLSGIDVATQSTNQLHQDPFLAIVVDPVRTAASGKVELGAFRCYPPDYVPKDAPKSEYQTIPSDKIEDFGVHANAYYPLEVSYFKSSLDDMLLRSLWNQYWAATLASSPLTTSAAYIDGQLADVATKSQQQAESSLSGPMRSLTMWIEPKSKKGVDDLTKLIQDSSKVAMELSKGTMSQHLKEQLFNTNFASPS
ncbi:uncharacterized protein MONBRDRAFT_19880, partial [Monosiga brevicollis MX1]